MAFDAFLKIEGIDGESTDRVHTNEIDIESFSWGASNPTTAGTGAGGGQGKVSVQDFHFTMASSKASPNLMLACCTGQHFQTATLTCRKAGGANQVEFLKIKLTDVLVSSFQTGGHLTDTGFSELGGNENLTTDEVTLNFVKIDYLYTSPRNPGVTSEAVFDTVAGIGG
jgi:type VI secretion system secreted protein Hcp